MRVKDLQIVLCATLAGYGNPPVSAARPSRAFQCCQHGIYPVFEARARVGPGCEPQRVELVEACI